MGEARAEKRLQRTARGALRVEGFSDAVFGFALTLLVVSLEVPASFAELLETMEGFLAFAICFAFIVWIWVEHRNFYRSFPIEDPATIFLNSALLFVVLFYVYPLKFLFKVLTRVYFGLGPELAAGGDLADGRRLMAIYSFGFSIVFLVLALMYLHAHRARVRLGFDVLAQHDARAGLVRHFATTAVGALSLALTFVLPAGRIGWAGWVFALLGPLHGTLGVRFGRRRARLQASLSTSDG